MLEWTFFLVSVYATRAQNLSAVSGKPCMYVFITYYDRYKNTQLMYVCMYVCMCATQETKE
jgi:hypothetical protein